MKGHQTVMPKKFGNPTKSTRTKIVHPLSMDELDGGQKSAELAAVTTKAGNENAHVNLLIMLVCQPFVNSRNSSTSLY
jgi:hypothetical protein